MSIFFHSFDPIVPFENLSAAIFFGGFLDAIKKAHNKSATSSVSTNATKGKDANISDQKVSEQLSKHLTENENETKKSN